MDTKQIKVIRALWGNSKTVLSEIPDRPLYDEYVYVWGIDNYNLLIEKGYQAELVNTYHSPFPSDYHTYFNKLVVFKNAVEKFSRILFLDWDCTQIKPLDSKFWQWFEDKTYAAPLYCFPVGMENYVSKMNDGERDWLQKIIPMLENYSWRNKNLFILPNACMVYLSDVSLSIKMIEDYRKYKMWTVEEFSMYTSIDCSLDYYLKNYEVPFVFGRPDSNYFSVGGLNGYFSHQLNLYIKSKIEKDIYFHHN